MIAYHCTTQKKFAQYNLTGCILSPVRFWNNLDSAKKWANRVGRNLIVVFEVDNSKCYKLPDHKPMGHAFWHEGDIPTDKFKEVINEKVQ